MKSLFKPVVRAIIINDTDEILMVKHTKDSLWVLPGWHVESDESIHDAILRELKEELWLEAFFTPIDDHEILHHKKIELEHLPLPLTSYKLSYTSSSWKDKSRTEYIFLMMSSQKDCIKQEWEIADYKWFEPEEILLMKWNIETYDFYIEMIEKLLYGEE